MKLGIPAPKVIVNSRAPAKFLYAWLRLDSQLLHIIIFMIIGLSLKFWKPLKYNRSQCHNQIKHIIDP